MTSNSSQDHLRHFSPTIIIGIHYVFPPPEVSGHQGKYPISKKNMDQGEGKWETTKNIMGCLVDGSNFTLQLMQEKCKEKSRLIKKVAKMKQRPLQSVQDVTGELQHSSFGIPGDKGLFPPIHIAMKKKECSF